MHKTKEIYDQLDGRSVLDLALHIHGYSNGSFDAPLERILADIKCLRDFIKTWDHSHMCDFDAIVLALLYKAEAESRCFDKYMEQE